MFGDFFGVGAILVVVAGGCCRGVVDTGASAGAGVTLASACVALSLALLLALVLVLRLDFFLISFFGY